MKKKLIVIEILIVAVFLFAGCEKELDKEETPEIGKEATAVDFEVINPWIRSAAGGMNTALFFEVINNTDLPDTLFGAESSLADIVEIHETYQKENDLMGMRHVDLIEIKSKSRLIFKPHSYHVMLIKLKNDLTTGETGNATLLFKKAGEIRLNAEIRDMSAIH